MKNTYRGVALALALTSLSSLPAHAQNEQERRSTFESARNAMQAKRWEEAYRLFRGLWQKQHTYDVALSLGQVEYHLSLFRDAATHLDYGLMLLPPREKPEIAERSRAILALCKQEVGTVGLRVKNKGAALFIDGVAVAEAPLVTDTYVEPGKHQFEVRLDGYQSEQWEAVFVKGDTVSRLVQLKPTTEPSPQAASALVLSPAVTTEPLDTVPRHASWSPVVVGGALSLIGVGTGLVLAVVRGGLTDDARTLRSKLGESNQRCVNPTDSNITALCDRLQSKNNDYDKYGVFEGAAFALGGVALVATATYYLIARPDKVHSTHVKSALPVRVDGSLGKGSARLLLSTDF
jgi:hypothetical protein